MESLDQAHVMERDLSGEHNLKSLWLWSMEVEDSAIFCLHCLGGRASVKLVHSFFDFCNFFEFIWIYRFMMNVNHIESGQVTPRSVSQLLNSSKASCPASWTGAVGGPPPEKELEAQIRVSRRPWCSCGFENKTLAIHGDSVPLRGDYLLRISAHYAWAIHLLSIKLSKDRNLTSDYTESCSQVFQHRCLMAEMFYSTDARPERFWRVGLARIALFFHSFAASKARKVHWISNQLNLTSSEPGIEWLANQLNLKSNDSQNDWISKQLNLKSVESHHLEHTSCESQTTWISNQLQLNPIEFEINGMSNQLTTKSLESQTNWQPNHLKFKSTDNHLKPMESEISKQLSFKSLEILEIQNNWIWNQLTFEPIEFYIFFL